METETELRPFVCAGWFTADPLYQTFAEKLMADLDGLGIEHSFKMIPKPAGKRWEAITLMKPQQAIFALQRHPGKVVILCDVDARVLAPLDDLANIKGDVAFYIRSRYRRSGGVKFGCRSGTVVFAKTEGAMRFATAWHQAALEAPWGSVDQDALSLCLGRTPGVCFQALDVKYCARPADNCPNQ